MSSISMRTAELPTLHAASSGLGISAKPGFIVAVVLLVTLGYTMPLTEGWRLSLTEHYGFDERLEAYASEGTLMRQLAIGSLGLFGLAAIFWPGGRRLRIAGPMGLLAVGYVVWCGTSSLWADQPMMSFRRFAALLCEASLALALVKHTSSRQFAWVVLSCTLTWMTLGLVAELSLGTFRPWAWGYRFAGIFHPNRMSVNCAVLVLASMYLYFTDQYRRRWLLGVAGLAFVMVLLAASRSALGAMVLAAAVVWALTAPRRRVLVGALGGVWLVALTVLLMAILQVSVTGDAVSLGRVENETSSLTGRLPLWEDLLRYVGQRPFIGHGYNSFWTVDHIRDVSDEQSWAISTAHSSYLDLLLNVGIIGTFLCLSTLSLGFLRAIRLSRKMPGMGYGFIAATILYGLSAGFFETTFGMSWFFQIFILSSVCYLAFVDPDAPVPDATPEVASRFPSRPVLGVRPI